MKKGAIVTLLIGARPLSALPELERLRAAGAGNEKAEHLAREKRGGRSLQDS